MAKFTENREEWNQELQQHCEEVYMDLEETKEVQGGRIEHFKRERDQQFTKNRPFSEITSDLVLQVRATRSENGVNGPEDAVVSEMIKQLLQEKTYIITKCFQERFMGHMEAPCSWRIVKLVCFYENPDAEPQERDKKLLGHSADIGDVETVRGVCYSASGKRDRTRKLEAVTRGRHSQHLLSTSPGDDDAIAAKTLGSGKRTEDQ